MRPSPFVTLNDGTVIAVDNIAAVQPDEAGTGCVFVFTGGATVAAPDMSMDLVKDLLMSARAFRGPSRF